MIISLTQRKYSSNARQHALLAHIHTSIRLRKMTLIAPHSHNRIWQFIIVILALCQYSHETLHTNNSYKMSNILFNGNYYIQFLDAIF